MLAEGLDAGALTIQWHLARAYPTVPSTSSIVRVLRRRGLITQQPRKRPRSSLIRFQAELPNQLWQTDATHWTLADGSAVEILNLPLMTTARLLLASAALRTVKAADAVATFHRSLDRKRDPETLERLKVRSGIRDLCAHMLRHTWATNFHRSGSGSRFDLMVEGGWTTGRMVERHTKARPFEVRRRAPSPFHRIPQRTKRETAFREAALTADRRLFGKRTA